MNWDTLYGKEGSRIRRFGLLFVGASYPLCEFLAGARGSVAVTCDFNGMSKSALVVLLYLTVILHEDAICLAKALRALRPTDLFIQEKDQRLIEQCTVRHVNQPLQELTHYVKPYGLTTW
ncbi:MAG: hypothetical protein GY820_22470 [Gammaproteobacteria bacterium]|nr:hypothetical protein [Gammaproteobacteria bacterium]